MAAAEVMQSPRTLGLSPEAITVNLGTRNSKLALIQANYVSERLAAAHHGIEFPINPVMVRGDADKKTPFLLMTENAGRPDAAKNLWTEEMEIKLCLGELDFLVHCLKDLPTMLPDQCVLGAIMQRADPTDALVIKAGSPYTQLDQLPDGSIIGTSSTRRKAILKRLYPKLEVRECRGNVDTRLRKLDDPEGDFACIILASAGLKRMSLHNRITSRLSPIHFPYAVGQGALAIEIREHDSHMLQLLQTVEAVASRWPCLAERALLRTLQGGCSSPIGVWSFFYQKEMHDEHGGKTQAARLRLHGRVIHPAGTREISRSACQTVSSDADAEALGITLAKKLSAAGADKLLTEIKQIEKDKIVANMDQATTNGKAMPILGR